MKQSITISPKAIKKALYAFLHRFHVVLFVFFVMGGLAVVVLMLNNTIVASGNPGDYTPATNSTSFDQTTIDRIEDLKTKDESSTNLDLSGRTNPFVE